MMISTFAKGPAPAAAIFSTLVLLAGLAAGPAVAATASGSALGDLLLPSVRQGRCPEFVKMLWTVAVAGAHMGPGDGWFGPARSRYGWKWLARRHGIAPTGRIARKDFRGPAKLFDALDRDRDGALTAADFDWSARSPFLRQAQQADMWFSRLDADSNGRISRAEWEAFFKQAARGKDHLSRDDLRAALALPPRPPGPPPGMPTRETLFRGLLSGEIGSFREGPDLNGPAPDFTLPTHDGKARIRLGDFRGKKPVVLVFGSFT